MRAVVVILILCTNIQCNSAKQAAPVMHDTDRIQGTWLLVSGERNGEKFTDDLVKNVKLTFEGNVLKTKKSNGVTEAKFALHPETNPKGIDFNMDGNLGLGIYKLEGDAFTILHGEVEQPRPADFDAVKGGDLTMLVLRKEN
jgi:uncharacterized protein (TIGR03067 family)